VDCAAGPQGLAHGEPGRGQRQPARFRFQPRGTHRVVRQQGPERARHDGALRRAQRRAVAVPVLPQPHLQRAQHQRHLRQAAAADVPARRRRRQPGAVRRADPQQVRQRLLPGPGAAARPPALGPGALQRRLPGRFGEGLQHQPGAVQRRLRDGHDQDGQPEAGGRDADGGQAQLQEGELRYDGAICWPPRASGN
jgi:hypothetical protein